VDGNAVTAAERTPAGHDAVSVAAKRAVCMCVLRFISNHSMRLLALNFVREISAPGGLCISKETK